MANVILKNNKVMVKCSNLITDAIYLALKEVSSQGWFKKPDHLLLNFINRFDQDHYGLGCISLDLDDFFKEKQELIALTDALFKVISLFEKKYGKDSVIVKKTREFYDNLIQEMGGI